MGSTPQLVAFVRQGLVTAWKGLRLKYPVDGNPAWIYGSSDPHCFGRQARPGAVLWVCGRRPPDPPGLVARIRVAALLGPGERPVNVDPRLWKHFERYRFIALGDPASSRFFPQNDAAEALLSLRFANRPTWPPADALAPRPGWTTRCSRYFRSPCLIRADRDSGRSGAEPLDRLADELTSRSVFLSWKHSDHGRARRSALRAFVRELIRRRIGVWWDELALPGPAGHRELYGNAPLLGSLLAEAMRETRTLIAVSSPEYGNISPGSADNWTLSEWQGGHLLPGGRSLRRAIYLLGGDSRYVAKEEADLQIAANDPADAAGEVARWLDLSAGCGAMPRTASGQTGHA